MNDEIYVLEWSKKQGFFHIQKASDTCNTNLMAFAANKDLNDYHVIALGSHDRMHAIASTLRKTLLDRVEQQPSFANQ